MGFKDLLAGKSTDSTADVVVGRPGVDSGGLDVLVPADTLGESEVTFRPVDVGQRGMPQVVEREVPVKVPAALPLGQAVADGADAEPITLPADEHGVVDAEPFTTIALPFRELSEFVDQGVRDEDVLRSQDGALAVPVLELAEGDAALDDALPVTDAVDVADIEGADLEFTHTGAESDGEDHMVADSVDMITRDLEKRGLLGLSQGDRRASFVGEAHEQTVADDGEGGQQEKSKKRNQAPLAIVKATEQEFSEWIASEIGFMEHFGRWDEKQIEFDPYQREFLAQSAGWRCVEKSRQVGYSWVFAGEAVARTHLRESHNSIFVSYNLEDSKQKIAYAAQFHEELPLKFQKKKVVDSKHQLGFVSNGASRRVSNIYSWPSRAPRGKKGDIYLDELAHYANDVEVYSGSTALIMRGDGQLTVCSTPLGMRGRFWEIARQQVTPYPTFWRQRVPWWLCGMFCRNRSVHAVAWKIAPKMTTEERVYKLGHRRLIEQYESNALEDFQQEFEVIYVDESMSFFPHKLILPCTDGELELAKDLTDIEFSGRLIAALDVGRKKDLSELVIFEEKPHAKVMKFRQSMDKWTFHAQEETCKQVMNLLPIGQFYIDQNGIGMNLAENLETDFPQVTPFTFSGTSKETLVNDFKILLQRKQVVLPRNRGLIAQTHSIRKRITAAGRPIYEATDSEKGHADLFWAIAMACQKEREIVAKPAKITVRCFTG